MNLTARMSKKQLILLIIFFVFQILIAYSFELSHDEAYYWLFSKKLDWGYFDHPPFVALIIKIFSPFTHSELTVRIGFIILQFLSFLILLHLTSFQSISLYLALSFPIVSFVGLFALPDGPLLFFSACYFMALKNYLLKDSIKNSLILGLCISCLLYSKYHGILLIFFTLLALPRLFKNKSFYLVAIFSFCLFLPHLFWQFEKNFPTIKYHLLERPKANFSFNRVFEFALIEIFLAGLFIGPVVWFILVKKKTTNDFEKTLKFMAIGTIIFFFISSFSKRIEANWSIFISFPLIILSQSSEIWKKKVISWLLFFSLFIVLSSRLLLIIPQASRKINRLNEFHGWKKWSEKIEDICHPLPLMANNYQLASKLSFYLNKKIVALNYQSRKNQFDLWRLEKDYPIQNVCYVTDKKSFQGEELSTPDGKKILIVKNKTKDQLWRLKLNER